VNYPGGYYCQCPETRQIAASQITTYPEQIPESDCQGFPFNHLGLYTCSNNDYGYQECQCPEAGTGTFKLVEGTGGCLAENIVCAWQANMLYTCSCQVTRMQNGGSTTRILTLNGTKCDLRNECDNNNGGCEHICTDQTDGFTCSCFDPPIGYNQDVWYLSDNTFDCLDVDECQNDTWVQAFCPSPSVCINTPGYYECQRTLGLSKSGEQESIAGSDTDGLTYGMMGWASAMTIAVGIIIAAVVVKKRSTPVPTSDIETSIAASARDVTLLPAESLSQHNNTIAQIHNGQQSNC